jgi:large subunit ribosomal protein L30
MAETKTAQPAKAAKKVAKKTTARKTAGTGKTSARKAAPKKRAAGASKPKAEKTVKVTLVKSVIGTRASHRATVRGLGLRRIRHSVELEDTPAVRGMIHKVAYLLRVEA